MEYVEDIEDIEDEESIREAIQMSLKDMSSSDLYKLNKTEFDKLEQGYQIEDEACKLNGVYPHCGKRKKMPLPLVDDRHRLNPLMADDEISNFLGAYLLQYACEYSRRPQQTIHDLSQIDPVLYRPTGHIRGELHRLKYTVLSIYTLEDFLKRNVKDIYNVPNRLFAFFINVGAPVRNSIVSTTSTGVASTIQGFRPKSAHWVIAFYDNFLGRITYMDPLGAHRDAQHDDDWTTIKKIFILFFSQLRNPKNDNDFLHKEALTEAIKSMQSIMTDNSALHNNIILQNLNIIKDIISKRREVHIIIQSQLDEIQNLSRHDRDILFEFQNSIQRLILYTDDQKDEKSIQNALTNINHEIRRIQVVEYANLLNDLLHALTQHLQYESGYIRRLKQHSSYKWMENEDINVSKTDFVTHTKQFIRKLVIYTKRPYFELQPTVAHGQPSKFLFLVNICSPQQSGGDKDDGDGSNCGYYCIWALISYLMDTSLQSNKRMMYAPPLTDRKSKYTNANTRKVSMKKNVVYSNVFWKGFRYHNREEREEIYEQCVTPVYEEKYVKSHAGVTRRHVYIYTWYGDYNFLPCIAPLENYAFCIPFDTFNISNIDERSVNNNFYIIRKFINALYSNYRHYKNIIIDTNVSDSETVENEFLLSYINDKLFVLYNPYDNVAI
jgi:hypothetical protein